MSPSAWPGVNLHPKAMPPLIPSSFSQLQGCISPIPKVKGPRRTVYARYPRLLPLPVGLAPNCGHVALDVALVALVPHHGVYFVAVLLPTKGPGVLHHGGVPAGHCRRWAETWRARGVLPG